MKAFEVLTLAAQALGIVFTLTLGIILIISLRKDGKLGADEASKVVIIGLLIYMTIVNANRITEYPTFGDGTYLIMLGSVLLLAGIDIAKAKNLLSNRGDRPDNSK